MRRYFAILGLMLVAFTFAFVLTVSRSQNPEPSLKIRIAAVAAKNSSGRTAITWETAVPRARNHRPAVLAWSVHIEETNKVSVQHSVIDLSASENELMSTTQLGSDEDGILQWSEGQQLEPQKAYRAVGAYHEPNRLDSLLYRCQRIPVIGRWFPGPTMVFATSQWFEVTARVEKETKHE